ncbi:MAG: HNH endonuclease, partial [Candidatus Desantisbacteria bacterium]
GDALGKTAKGIRLAAKTAKLKKKIEATTATIKKLKAAARETEVAKKAAAAVRKARIVVAKDKIAVKKKMCASCPKRGYSLTDDIFGTRLPTDGVWENMDGTPGRIGASDWYPDLTTPRGKKILKEIGNKPIKYKNGHPDFSEYVYEHNGTLAKVEIDMQGYVGTISKNDNVYEVTPDFNAANEAMRKIDPNWKKPKNYTWHHNEDGVTMELVPTAIHKNVPHTGGASIVTDPGY